jgi:hypothetical protein
MVQQSPLSFPFGDGVVVIQNNILYHFFGNQMESFCLPIQNLGDLAATFSSDAASIEEKWNFLREIHVVFSQFLEEHTLSYQRNAEKAKADRSLNGIFVGLGGFAQIWNSDHREINVKCFVISLNPEQSPLRSSFKVMTVDGRRIVFRCNMPQDKTTFWTTFHGAIRFTLDSEEIPFV